MNTFLLKTRTSQRKSPVCAFSKRQILWLEWGPIGSETDFTYLLHAQ